MLTFLLIAVAIIVGASIIVGRALSGPRQRARRADPHDPVTALKASGALKHRKSNRN